MKYYSLNNILSKKAKWNLIIGERSNGKTYAVLNRIINNYAKTKKQGALIRRWDEDFKSKRASTMFDALVANNEISKATGGEWSNVSYYAGRWFLCRTEDDKIVKDDTPFCYAFSLTSMEHDKSTSYPNVTTILFDEFLTRGAYLPDEFILLSNVISTIVRQRSDADIFMCGNTVNKYSPYFSEMGLTRIKELKKGDIQVYEYGNSGLRVAVEFSDSPSKSKDSNIYFAFDNPRLSMITGEGTVWEIAVYPHCPCKYEKRDVIFSYFIIFNGDILQADIVNKDNISFTFIHKKTTKIQDEKSDIIFTPDYNPSPNYFRNILKTTVPFVGKLSWFFNSDKVFYQDNETGEIVRNYLQFCKNEKGVI